MPRKPKPIEEHKIDYGTAKSHYLNLLFKAGKPSVSGSDIKKGSDSYNEIVKLQQTLKEKDFILLLAELADISPTHWTMMARFYEKRGYEYKPAGEVLKDAQAFYNVDVIAPPPAPAPAPIIITETKKETKMTIFQARIEYNELSRQFDDELLTENNEIVLDDLFKRIEKLKKELDIDAS